MNKKYEVEEIDEDDPAFGMIGNRFSRLLGKESQAHRHKHREDGDYQGKGHHDRRSKRVRDRLE